jgi:hypothetical protein
MVGFIAASALDIIMITPSSSPNGTSSDRDAAIERRSGVVELAGVPNLPASWEGWRSNAAPLSALQQPRC